MTKVILPIACCVREPWGNKLGKPILEVRDTSVRFVGSLEMADIERQILVHGAEAAEDHDAMTRLQIYEPLLAPALVGQEVTEGGVMGTRAETRDRRGSLVWGVVAVLTRCGGQYTSRWPGRIRMIVGVDDYKGREQENKEKVSEQEEKKGASSGGLMCGLNQARSGQWEARLPMRKERSLGIG